jgi:phosphopantothenate synthetase
LIEFKLGSNSQLKRNLEKQLPIYAAANRTRTSVKVIVYYTARDEKRVNKILKELKLDGEKSIVLIDARSDNKPSASRA